MTRQSHDEIKEKFIHDMNKQVAEFHAKGGKVQELPHGESVDGKRAFTISPTRKDLPVKDK